MHKTNKSKAERAQREVRRRDRKIEILQQENAALLKRALDAEKGAMQERYAFQKLTVQMAFAYGEDVMDEERGKSIGKRLTLPAISDDEAKRWRATGWKNGEGVVQIAVGLRDDPDDHKTDAQLAEEAAAHKAAEGGGNDE